MQTESALHRKLPFRERLKQGPILCDGAMGTLLDLYEYSEIPHEIQNLKNPDIVERIHREYIDAGAEIIQTNTFAANRLRLSQYWLEDRCEEINARGVEIARRAAGNHIYVAGSVGPSGKLLEPLGKVAREQARDAFREQIEVLVDSGVDLLILETFVSLSELDEAIAAAKEVGDVPLVAQKAFPEDGSILSGSFPVEVVEHIIQKGVDVVGANCTVGPQRMFSIIRSMYKHGVILSAQPAAGIPTLLNGRSIYHTSPEYLAQYARELVEAGVTLVGACCGSTPAHIRAIRGALNALEKTQPTGIRPADHTAFHPPMPDSPKISGPRKGSAEIRPEELVPSTRFAEALGKKFLVSVELDIPRGLEMDEVVEGARYLQGLGVDAVNVTDGARARLRMSPIAIAHQVQSKVGLEAVTHLATRDRNMISLQSELMSAHAFGLNNILCVTGDPTNIGDYPQATSVFDIDAAGLIRAAKSMNAGCDIMGNSIGSRTSFFIACAANPVAEDIETEIQKLQKKVEAGADIMFTQPIYEMKTLEEFLDRIGRFRIPVMVGVLPLRSYRHAEFLHNEVPGISIPHSLRESLRKAGDEATTVGVEIATLFLQEAKKLVSGVYLMPPFRKYDVVRIILEGAEIAARG
ncbi:MAG: bifunctional homocysteine S-methyltransferase/methylenetetrahydrofolate reductase [Ignavibacteria bacterium]|nr:bifunctional homocysteine S-methyltransferase/methylenetetrahydrofolate reductase [Ignavibacteria bacterium]